MNASVNEHDEDSVADCDAVDAGAAVAASVGDSVAVAANETVINFGPAAVAERWASEQVAAEASNFAPASAEEYAFAE